MKTLSFTDFRKGASSFITDVEHGESIVILRNGKPVAEVVPYHGSDKKIPSWKKKGIQLQLDGVELSSSILEERDSEW
ncbi:MAG: type II toxin-antitoxin system Phd/YefM family antitoxin [Planctomycetota bacterium]|jgi:prevent-host-death family protein